jgi:hypothetical protein
MGVQTRALSSGLWTPTSKRDWLVNTKALRPLTSLSTTLITPLSFGEKKKRKCINESIGDICEELKIQKFQQFSQNNTYSSYQGPVSIALVLLDSESNFLTTRLQGCQNRQVLIIILDILNKMLMVLTTMIPEGLDGRGMKQRLQEV